MEQKNRVRNYSRGLVSLRYEDATVGAPSPDHRQTGRLHVMLRVVSVIVSSITSAASLPNVLVVVRISVLTNRAIGHPVCGYLRTPRRENRKYQREINPNSIIHVSLYFEM